MRDMILNIRKIAGKDSGKLIPVILLSVLDSMLNSCMYGVMIFILIDLADSIFTFEKLKLYSLILLGVFLLRCVTQAISLSKVQHDGPVISKKLRLSLGNHIRSLNLGFFNQNSQGRLNAILTTDVSDFETILTHCVCDLVKAIAFSVFSLLIAFALDWKFGIAIGVIALLGLPLLNISGTLSARSGKRTHSAKENVVSHLLEYIGGIKTFRLYNLTGERFSRLDDALLGLKKESTKAELSLLPFILSFSTVTSCLIPIALILGAYLLTVQSMEPVSFIAVLLIAVSVSSMMSTLGSLYPQVRSLNRACENMLSVLGEKPFSYEKETLKASNADIAFDHVSFSYTGKEQVLKDISFAAKQGTTTALIGPSGSGKTTIVSLLSRFWDVTGGRITIGGQDIRDISPDALTANMAVVFQDVYLLNDTIMNNIKVGKPDASDAEVISAARSANCHDFIVTMENGYDTMIGEGGSTISGGERQRISIARALLKDAPIVLLDETTSSLDADNEREIQAAFDRLMQNKTVFVIAHRLNTIMGADNILVLNQGEIMEFGNHKELMRTGGWYAQMVEQQRQAEQWAV
ncbi:ATP-binding cassette, subfamily B [Anaerovirgula multivorans]|uniref:ATP-binding cassette, subfamily B n=1 Tax=Anaerovirgula multivorans TaxID=312168 RepID=A0A239AXA0_9FIRM|nr:ABC transporter ATP-binding protein [Anaerovirgula multivorans]SNR99608.1 ATP-binding cassette, subfamily B [Anaerovirgula multivorans]